MNQHHSTQKQQAKETVKRLMDAKVRVPVASLEFDPAAETIPAAIKAIWKTYRRGQWFLLDSLGITRAEYADVFYDFDNLYITSDHGLIYREDQVRKLIQMTGPRLVARAMEAIERYQMVTRETRTRHYELEGNVSTASTL